ncbi:MAG: hypothetical protein OEY59_10035, partial [Deltaproteobacteria bacterium]|nr:hypothetical protein [Deltaproteobacteria bacterium]
SWENSTAPTGKWSGNTTVLTANGSTYGTVLTGNASNWSWENSSGPTVRASTKGSVIASEKSQVTGRASTDFTGKTNAFTQNTSEGTTETSERTTAGTTNFVVDSGEGTLKVSRKTDKFLGKIFNMGQAHKLDAYQAERLLAESYSRKGAVLERYALYFAVSSQRLAQVILRVMPSRPSREEMKQILILAQSQLRNDISKAIP